MKRFITIVLLHLVCSYALHAQEKTKEILTDNYNLDINKIEYFIQVIDSDLKTSVPAKVTVAPSRRKRKPIFEQEVNATTRVVLPIDEVYTVTIEREGYDTEEFEFDATKVKDYYVSRTINLKPKRTSYSFAVDEASLNDDTRIILRHKNSNEKIIVDRSAKKNGKYEVMVRDGEDYELEIKDYKNKVFFSKNVNVNSKNKRNNRRNNNEPAEVITIPKNVTALNRKPEPKNTPTNIEVNANTNNINENPNVAEVVEDNTENKALKLKEKIVYKDKEEEVKRNATDYEDAIQLAKDEVTSGQRDLIKKQRLLKKRIREIERFLEDENIPPTEKERLKKLINELKAQIERYDNIYQKLRDENLGDLYRIERKLGIATWGDFWDRYWAVILTLLAVVVLMFGAMIFLYIQGRRRRKQRDKLAVLNNALNEKNEEIRQQNEEIMAQRDALEESSKVIAEEKKKSEDLLLNILPKPVAEELKATGRAQMKSYERVSILFTDFKGFTQVAARMTPDKLMNELNDCFTGFDKIIKKHNLEKIKTIGDAYMCAGGIPEANITNPVDSIMAGLEMQEFMKQRRAARLAEGDEYWRCRLGINTGEIRAGVIGESKFAYDIWGDPVNIASRMESGGEIDRVNISGQTYELVKDFFECEYRGEVEVKNKLVLQMYFVNRIKPELSADNIGITPNKKFLKLKQEQFTDKVES